MEYVGDGDNAIALWRLMPHTPVARDTAVLICPPLGSEFVRAYRSLRRLAEYLCAAGFVVYRPDYFGTGDSGGSILADDCLERWVTNITTVSKLIADRHPELKQCWLGLRLGATLAALAAQQVAVAELVLLAPIVKGRGYVREMEALSRLSGQEQDAEAGYLESAGFLISQATAARIKDINLTRSYQPVTPGDVLLLDRDDRPGDSDLAGSWEDAGCKVTVDRIQGYADMMDEPHYGKVPWQTWERINDWLQQRSATVGSVTLPSVGQPRLQLSVEGAEVEELPLLFGTDGALFGVLARPLNSNPASSTCIVLANSGSVHHVGPNSIYTEISRRLVSLGYYVLRMDLENLGDSRVLDPAQENHPYQSRAVASVHSAIEFLRQRFGLPAFVVGGLCSGAHTAFHCGLDLTDLPVKQVMMINPLTFYWHHGMSLKTPDETQVYADQAHYSQSLKSLEKWKKLLSGKANVGYIGKFIGQRLLRLVQQCLKDGRSLLLGENTRLASDIRAMHARGMDISFVLASTDPGLDIIRSQAKWTLRRGVMEKWIRLHVIDAADHTFSRKQARDRLLAVLAQHFDRVNSNT